jgi:hypothetical protein
MVTIVKINNIVKSKKIYTVHDLQHNPLTLLLKSKTDSDISKTTLIGFANKQNGILVSNLLEKHKNVTKEYPKFLEDERLYIKKNDIISNDLSNLYIREWELDDLKIYCLQNILDLLRIEELIEKDFSINFKGTIFKFEAGAHIYIDIFNKKL